MCTEWPGCVGWRRDPLFAPPLPGAWCPRMLSLPEVSMGQTGAPRLPHPLPVLGSNSLPFVKLVTLLPKIPELSPLPFLCLYELIL